MSDNDKKVVLSKKQAIFIVALIIVMGVVMLTL